MLGLLKKLRLVKYGLSQRKISIHNNKRKERIAAFISIPKNASKSVLEILELGPNRDHENTDSLVIYENHQRMAVLKQKYYLDPLFVFCFSRNPYDRCISWYEYHRNIWPYNEMTFDVWVKEGMPHHFKVQNQTDYVALGISPLLQYHFVEGYKMDFIGRLESFESDLAYIVDQLNRLCGERELEHRFSASSVRVNTSKRKTRMDGYFNTESKAIVQDLLSEDFRFFGYEK